VAALWRRLGESGRRRRFHRPPLPQPGPDELLVRHDAVGICFSDIKVIRAGENHPAHPPQHARASRSCSATKWR
jgi:threonine dehydrogenase-like Zn-dependent dehydrogenase